MRPKYRPGVNKIDHLFIHQAELWRMTKTKNPGGGFTETWAKVADVKCRISTYTPKQYEKIEQEKQQFPVTHRIYFPMTAQAKADDRVKYRGKHYQIDEPTNPSFADHHLEAHAKVVNVVGG